MLNNYYTLIKVVESMEQLIGSRITECFSQEKNSIMLIFYDGSDEYYMQFNGNTQNTSLFLREKFSKARKNTIDLFPALYDEVLQSVRLLPNDRIIIMKFIHTTVYFYVFDGSKSNVIITNQNEIIIDSFKSSKLLKNTKFDLPNSKNELDFEFNSNITIQKFLAKSNFNFGSYYARELLNRLHIQSNKQADLLSDEEHNNIKKYAIEFREELENSNDFYLVSNDNQLLLSLIPLNDYFEIQNKFSDINQAIFNRLINTIKNNKSQLLNKNMSLSLNRQKEKLEKKIELIKDEEKLINRIKKYKLWADLLSAQSQTKQKNIASIIVKNYNDTDIEIPLKEKLNLIENAKRYYEKSHDSKEEFKIKKKLLPNLELQLLKINNTIDKLGNAQTIKELEKLQKNLKQLSGIKVQDGKEKTKQFREFDLGDGFILYVGKNAANNDELTMKFAKPNDLWFHARGSGGSHVVLRINKGQKPPKYIIKKAASIAAYYSQARKAKYTPVAYTFKKYVRKPKGANPGSVTMSKEEVIMVEPKLPE